MMMSSKAHSTSCINDLAVKQAIRDRTFNLDPAIIRRFMVTDSNTMTLVAGQKCRALGMYMRSGSNLFWCHQANLEALHKYWHGLRSGPLEQDHHHNDDQVARRCQIFCLIFCRRFGDMISSGCITDSIYSQPIVFLYALQFWQFSSVATGRSAEVWNEEFLMRSLWS